MNRRYTLTGKYPPGSSKRLDGVEHDVTQREGPIITDLCERYHTLCAETMV
jgi:hypothetical protein